MAEALTIACPACGKKFNVPATVIGKKVRCKACGAVIPVSATSAVAAGKPASKKDGKGKSAPRSPQNEDEGEAKPYGVSTQKLGARCPECAFDMREGDIICLKCGYNTQTRVRVTLKKTADTTAMDQFLWLLPGILCALLIVILIVWDIVHITKSDSWFAPEDTMFFICSGAVKLWNVVISLAIIFFAGKFAIKRLILHPTAPEVEIKA